MFRLILVGKHLKVKTQAKGCKHNFIWPSIQKKIESPINFNHNSAFKTFIKSTKFEDIVGFLARKKCSLLKIFPFLFVKKKCIHYK